MRVISTCVAIIVMAVAFLAGAFALSFVRTGIGQEQEEQAEHVHEEGGHTDEEHGD